MAQEVRVPTTGNAGEDAVILQIAVAVGDMVSAGQVIATLETAKASVDVEALDGGTVLAIHAAEGDEVAEHSVLMTIGLAGESTNELAAPSEPVDALVHNAESTPEKFAERVSPRARIYAERKGLSLEDVRGTGPLGRVLIADVKDFLSKNLLQTDALKPSSTASKFEFSSVDASPPYVDSAFPDDTFEIIPVKGSRKVTAERMAESLRNSAQLTITRYADATVLLSYLKRRADRNIAGELSKVSLNDAILFACSQTLVKHPSANSYFDFSGIKQFSNVHIGFAVDTGSALLVPVIPFANLQSLKTLSGNAKALISKAKEGKLTVEEMSNGTFTVTNLGSLGVHWFTPVLNPPQTCILGIGSAHKYQESAPTLLPLSLTFDHRAIDGAAAAALLADIAKAIEDFDLLVAE